MALAAGQPERPALRIGAPARGRGAPVAAARA